jgi:hypothetical protein
MHAVRHDGFCHQGCLELMPGSIYSNLCSLSSCVSASTVSGSHGTSGARTLAEHLPSSSITFLMGCGLASLNSALTRKICVSVEAHTESAPG